MDKWAELSAFVAVVDHEGFAAAARFRHVSPSGLSRLVSNLEDRLGVQLLKRTTRRINLTEAGERLYQRGSSILSDLSEAEADVANLNAAPRGRLRVSCVQTLAERQMRPIFADFMARYPEISIDIREHAHPHELVADTVDVALITGELNSSSHVVRKVARFKRIICASPEYLETHGTPAEPQELHQHHCLSFCNNSERQRWGFRCPDGSTEEVCVDGVLSANSADTLLQAALAGIGVCRLANFVVGPHLRSGELIELFSDRLLDDEVPFAVVYSAKRHVAPKVRAFIDHVVERFTPNAPWDGETATSK